MFFRKDVGTKVDGFAKKILSNLLEFNLVFGQSFERIDKLHRGHKAFLTVEVLRHRLQETSSLPKGVRGSLKSLNLTWNVVTKMSLQFLPHLETSFGILKTEKFKL